MKLSWLSMTPRHPRGKMASQWDRDYVRKSKKWYRNFCVGKVQVKAPYKQRVIE